MKLSQSDQCRKLSKYNLDGVVVPGESVLPVTSSQVQPWYRPAHLYVSNSSKKLLTLLCVR